MNIEVYLRDAQENSMLILHALMIAMMLVVSMGATAQAQKYNPRDDPNMRGTVPVDPKNIPSGSFVMPSNQGDTTQRSFKTYPGKTGCPEGYHNYGANGCRRDYIPPSQYGPSNR